MALTRITGTVIEDNAITTDKISNLSLTTAMIAPGAVTADKLAANTSTAGPITTQIAAVSLALSSNTNSVKANVDAAEANIAAILNTTTDLNIGSGRYVFDKSTFSLGIANANPAEQQTVWGSPANVIIYYDKITGGNVLIGAASNVTPYRFDVRGTANTGALTALSFGNVGIPDALSFVASDGLATFKDDVTVTGNLIVHNTSSFINQVTMSDDLVVTGNLTVLGDTTTVNTENLIIQDNFMALANSQPFGSVTSLDSGIFFNRGSSGNAALYYDTSAKGFAVSETRDPFSNTTISPTGAANLTVGGLTTSALTIGATLVTSTATELNTLDGVTGVSAAEINHLDGVTSAIQTQIDTKIATTASASNDFITFARLNANVNIVQDNVTTLAGGSILLKPFTNSNIQAVGSTANTFFIGTAMPGDALANTSFVTLDGIVQQKDVPSGAFAANNDFIINAAAAHASIKFTRANIPVGTKVNISVFRAV